jgi:hypothetical protein
VASGAKSSSLSSGGGWDDEIELDLDADDIEILSWRRTSSAEPATQALDLSDFARHRPVRHGERVRSRASTVNETDRRPA